MRIKIYIRKIANFKMLFLILIVVYSQSVFYVHGQVKGYEQVEPPHPKNNPESPKMLACSWVPDNHHKIDFNKLPLIKSQHSVVSDVRVFNGVNQHNYLTYFNGKYWAMWSDGPGVEDRVAQRVAFSTSTDGLNWSDKKYITPDQPGSDTNSSHYNTRTEKGFRYISRGFWQLEGGELVFEMGHEPNKQWGINHEDASPSMSNK